MTFEAATLWQKMQTVLVSQKNVLHLTCYNFDMHDTITIIFGRRVIKKVRRCFVFPSHLSSASALPCERGNPEHSALVHFACNTVQLLQRFRLPFSWTMAHKSPKLNVLVTRFRESYSSVSMSRESKGLNKSGSNWLNSGNTNTDLSENAILVFPVLPGSAEAQVTWGGTVKRILIACFIGNVSAKKISKSVHVCQSYSKPKVERFLRHGVLLLSLLSHLLY